MVEIKSGPGNEPTKLPELSWETAAKIVGEQLSTVGPTGYYSMGPHTWLRWALDTIGVAKIEASECSCRYFLSNGEACDTSAECPMHGANHS